VREYFPKVKKKSFERYIKNGVYGVYKKANFATPIKRAANRRGTGEIKVFSHYKKSKWAGIMDRYKKREF